MSGILRKIRKVDDKIKAAQRVARYVQDGFRDGPSNINSDIDRLVSGREKKSNFWPCPNCGQGNALDQELCCRCGTRRF